LCYKILILILVVFWLIVEMNIIVILYHLALWSLTLILVINIFIIHIWKILLLIRIIILYIISTKNWIPSIFLNSTIIRRSINFLKVYFVKFIAFCRFWGLIYFGIYSLGKDFLRLLILGRENTWWACSIKVKRFSIWLVLYRLYLDFSLWFLTIFF